jgi:hypothetical protein
MSNVATASTKTEPYSTLAVVTTGYADVVLKITNGSSQPTSFKIVNDAGTAMTSSDISVPGSTSSNTTLKRLTPGKQYNLYLQRLESGTYVNQISDTSTKTQMTTFTCASSTITSSVAYSGATATISIVSTADDLNLNYLLFTTAAFTASSKTPQVTPATQAITQLTGLSPSTSYTLLLVNSEPGTTDGPYTDKIWYNQIDKNVFTTSGAATLSVASVMCTSAVLSWTGDTSSFYRVVDVNNANAVVVADIQGPKNATMPSLTPGTAYSLKLQLKQSTSYVDQGTVQFTTATSTMSINNVTDVMAKVNWTSAYTNANYTLAYGTSDATMKTVPTQALTYQITDLVPNNTYTFKLSVIEGTKSVGLATDTISTSTSTNSNTTTSTDTAITTSTSNTTTAATAAKPTNASSTANQTATAVVKPKTSGGAIAGIVIGLVALICLGGAGYYFYNKNKKTAATAVKI